MSPITLLRKPVDWQLHAVRIFVACVVLGILVGIKYVFDIPWISYLAVLVVLPTSAIALCVWLRRRSSSKQASAKTPSADPTPNATDPSEIPTAESQGHTSLSSDPQPTAVLPAQSAPRGGQSPTCPILSRETSLAQLPDVVFERHWKMAVIEAGRMILLPLAVITWIMVYGRDMTLSPTQLTLIVICLILLMVYAVRRAIYSYRHRGVKIVGNRLIVDAPHCIRFWFLGGPLELDITDISAVNLGKATPVEMLIFKKVRTVTIDTAALEDHKAHNLKHMINAKEVGKAIFARKHELRMRVI